MSAFGGEYAAYYDLFYANKDYASEASFVRDIINRYRPGVQSILELGCGSARHAVELVQGGVSVTGIDLSAEMIACGQEQLRRLAPQQRSRVILQQGDATRYVSTTIYDAVISLFHVVSYQTGNDALVGIFRSARTALNGNGLFVFDFWYGPAVLTERPEVRVKRLEQAGIEVTRISEPVHYTDRNVVDVNYTLLISDPGNGRFEKSQETHSMRYLFLPEIELLAAMTGFGLIQSGEWLTGRPLHDRSWHGYAVLRPVQHTA